MMMLNVFRRVRTSSCCPMNLRVSSFFSLSKPSNSAKKSRPAAAEISAEVGALFDEALGPLNERILGPLDGHVHETTKLPLVFCLGNHSSGKSSFINHVLGRKVQATGVAPTDDSFTVIGPSVVGDLDQDGAALIGDPKMGFTGLRRFGMQMATHLSLKMRTETKLKDVFVVDSPGMIDSAIGGISSSHGGDVEYDRGYDFIGVTKWFSQRADVILLFFDPSKPGTTGETLTAMTSSLKGHEHKLHIILNKSDKFEKITDFARAYGTLCWNISKVINRKDLPKIYTTCVPVPGDHHKPGLALLTDGDLQDSREDIISQLHLAPERRVDNDITRLYDSSRMLLMHAKMLDAVRRQHKRIYRRQWGTTLAILSTGAVVAGSAVLYDTALMIDVAVASGAVASVTATFAHIFQSKRVSEAQANVTSEDGLENLLRREYHLALNDDAISLWERVKPQLRIALNVVGAADMVKQGRMASLSEIKKLESIINEDVPRLRSLTSATQTMSNWNKGVTHIVKKVEEIHKKDTDDHNI